MRSFFFIPLQIAFLSAAIPACAATWISSSVMTQGQFTTRTPGQVGPPTGNGTSGGQTTSNSGTNGVGGPQEPNNPGAPDPEQPNGQATFRFDDVSMTWSVQGSYGGFASGILGVELFGPAPFGYDATAATRYSFLLENDGGRSGTFSGSGVFTPAQADDLHRGVLALQIRTGSGAGDSIRGQLATVVPEGATTALLGMAATGLITCRRRSRR
jgi:hypothetical protein